MQKHRNILILLIGIISGATLSLCSSVLAEKDTPPAKAEELQTLPFEPNFSHVSSSPLLHHIKRLKKPPLSRHLSLFATWPHELARVEMLAPWPHP